MTIKNKINTNTSAQLSESSLIILIFSKSLLKLPPLFRINSVLDTKFFFVLFISFSYS